MFFNLKHQNFINNDAAVPGLRRAQAYALPFIFPERELLSKFVKQCSRYFALSDTLQIKNANLRAQRDLLLPKLISGELDVSETEDVLEETAV